MTVLTTVLGPIEAEKLGYCQMHEHIFVLDTPAAAINPALRADARCWTHNLRRRGEALRRWRA